MTKRVQINEVPYQGIQVGEKVMFLSTSFSSTRVNYGFYRGTRMSDPVVEYFYRERKWRWDDERKKYIQDKNWTISSRRVFLARRRVFNVKTLQRMFDCIPTKEFLAELIEKNLSECK